LFLAGSDESVGGNAYWLSDNWFLCMVGKRYGDRSTYRGEVGVLMTERKRGLNQVRPKY